MKLNLDTLVHGRTAEEVEMSVPLRPDDPETERFDAHGNLAVDAVESRVLVSGELDVEGEGRCDRCLGPSPLSFEAHVEIMIVRTAAPAPEQDEDMILHQIRGVVDLTEPLRESVLLHLPQKTVCRDDCLGLCPGCGADRNTTPCDCAAEPTDPRWDALPS